MLLLDELLSIIGKGMRTVHHSCRTTQVHFQSASHSQSGLEQITSRVRLWRFTAYTSYLLDRWMWGNRAEWTHVEGRMKLTPVISHILTRASSRTSTPWSSTSKDSSMAFLGFSYILLGKIDTWQYGILVVAQAQNNHFSAYQPWRKTSNPSLIFKSLCGQQEIHCSFAIMKCLQKRPFLFPHTLLMQ
jgi:hypothetical protein